MQRTEKGVQKATIISKSMKTDKHESNEMGEKKKVMPEGKSVPTNVIELHQ